MRLIWTDEEISLLEKHYPTSSVEEILKLLPRFDIDKIRIKASQLKIKREVREPKSPQRKMTRWTQEEIDILSKNYKDTPNAQLLELLPRFNMRQIGYKARQLKLKKSDKVKEIDLQNQISIMLGDKEWTEDELTILEDNYEHMGSVGVNKLIPNRTLGAIKTKAQKMGLSTSREAKWIVTSIKANDKDIFSINTKFERVDL